MAELGHVRPDLGSIVLRFDQPLAQSCQFCLICPSFPNFGTEMPMVPRVWPNVVGSGMWPGQAGVGQTRATLGTVVQYWAKLTLILVGPKPPQATEFGRTQ